MWILAAKDFAVPEIVYFKLVPPYEGGTDIQHYRQPTKFHNSTQSMAIYLSRLGRQAEANPCIYYFVWRASARLHNGENKTGFRSVNGFTLFSI